MDIKRAPQKKTRRNLLIAGGVVALVATTVALSNLEARAPGVSRSELWVDSVQRGTMVRQVRAPGTLVPENIRYVAAVTAGRVEARPLRPGSPVKTSTILLELSNPEVQLQALEAQRQLTQAEQDLVTLKTTLETNRLSQASMVAQMRTLRATALRDAAVTEGLDAKGLSSKNEVERARDIAIELQARLDLEQQRLDILSSAMGEQLSKARANLEQMRAVARFQQERVASMRVNAGLDGELQTLPLELGQWVVPGQVLATVAQPGRLKAVLRVPETQAKDIVIGQKTAVDTRNGIIDGRVMRVDPISTNGTVTVEIALEGELPKGARADLSVDGVIELERLEQVLYVGRPAYGQPEQAIGLFRIEPDGKTAIRMSVKLGRASVSTIEVLQGLQTRDSVIISDMSRFDNVNRVRIER
ncbi:MAG: HlyD family efflux transporter periplasmic adaptor subunit [Gemmatimonadaceae bacterium]|nr:HlyD family efflux transporter periplasmic adaptor subunit [Gemmatimonadaceae bacterium]